MYQQKSMRSRSAAVLLYWLPHAALHGTGSCTGPLESAPSQQQQHSSSAVKQQRCKATAASSSTASTSIPVAADGIAHHAEVQLQRSCHAHCGGAVQWRSTQQTADCAAVFGSLAQTTTCSIDLLVLSQVLLPSLPLPADSGGDHHHCPMMVAAAALAGSCSSVRCPCHPSSSSAQPGGWMQTSSVLQQC